MTSQAMTTAGLHAKVRLRQAWFEAHPNQPMPEGKAEFDRLLDAIEDEARGRVGVHLRAEPHHYRLECVVCGVLGQIRVSIDPQEAASALDPDPEYAYLRDGSVLGRVTGWRGGVPIIDTTDRRPGSPVSGPLDSAPSLAGMPSEPLSEASWPPAAVTGGGRVPHGLSSPAAVHPPIAAGPSDPSAGVTG